MNCKERNYELIMEITAYPDSAVSFKSPIQVYNKYLEFSDITLDETQAISIPVMRKTGKLSETEKVELSGKSYTVTLTWDADKLDKETYDKLKNLEKEFKHLKIKTFGNNFSFVRSTEDGYRFTQEEEAGVMKCELSVMNISGIQRML